jgi:hypothetical protein
VSNNLSKLDEDQQHTYLKVVTLGFKASRKEALFKSVLLISITIAIYNSNINM